jgi:hypothetical protein
MRSIPRMLSKRFLWSPFTLSAYTQERIKVRPQDSCHFDICCHNVSGHLGGWWCHFSVDASKCRLFFSVQIGGQRTARSRIPDTAKGNPTNFHSWLTADTSNLKKTEFVQIIRMPDLTQRGDIFMSLISFHFTQLYDWTFECAVHTRNFYYTASRKNSVKICLFCLTRIGKEFT